MQEHYGITYCLSLGLSSHTANLLANGDILLVGREGSLRIQRKSGQVYQLIGDFKRGMKVLEANKKY